nr:MAG TPA: hypothetical protein [Bacteriophage sp.]
MKVSKLNWLNIGRGYESIRLILNKKKVEAMGYDKEINNEVIIEYDIENQTIIIKPFKPQKKQAKNIVVSAILEMKGDFSVTDIMNKVSKLDSKLANNKDIEIKLEQLTELGLIGKSELCYFSLN